MCVSPNGVSRNWAAVTAASYIVPYLLLLAVVAVFVVFACCLMYWFDWGTETDEAWGCTANTTCCVCDPPALTYKLEDVWQERMTQGLPAASGCKRWGCRAF